MFIGDDATGEAQHWINVRDPDPQSELANSLAGNPCYKASQATKRHLDGEWETRILPSRGAFVRTM